MKALANIIEEHAEEAAFLWLLRDGATRAPHYLLSDLADLDERLEAHVDALRLAGETGWDMCKEQMAWEEGGEVFAAAVLALESKDRLRLDTVLEVGTSNPDASRGLISAMGWLPYEHVAASIAQVSAASSPELRRVGIASAVAHRITPGRTLEEALRASDLRLRARALRAVGQLGSLGLCPPDPGDEDQHCRFSAAWSAGLLGNAKAVGVLQQLVEVGGPDREEAAMMALRRLALPSAEGWRRELATDPRCSRLAVMGAGVVGDPASVPWLIETMATPELARVAGEALTMITGVDLAMEHLDARPPRGFESGPTDNPEDENVGMDPDEHLPWPDPRLVERWWHAHRDLFQHGCRYLVGHPIAEEMVRQVLRDGSQRQRNAAALELAILTPGRPLFEVRAPARQQQALLFSRD